MNYNNNCLAFAGAACIHNTNPSTAGSDMTLSDRINFYAKKVNITTSSSIFGFAEINIEELMQKAIEALEAVKDAFKKLGQDIKRAIIALIGGAQVVQVTMGNDVGAPAAAQSASNSSQGSQAASTSALPPSAGLPADFPSSGEKTTGAKTISQTGVNLIKHFEGLKLNAYTDSGGVWTIGYGHTGNVSSGMSITEAQAESMLKQDLASFERAVNSYVTVPITQNQFDALVSFSYNVGAGALKGSTLLKLLNQGDYNGAAEQFARWNKCNGSVLQGLVNRRHSEKQLFLS